MKRWIAVVLAALVLASVLWLPAPLGGIREAEAETFSLDGCTEIPLDGRGKLKSNKNLKEFPYADADTVHSLSTDLNQSMTICSMWKNKYGNYWYEVYAEWKNLTGSKVGGFGYLYAGDVEFLYAMPAGHFSVASPTSPSSVNVGSGFHIKGTIKSDIFTITGVYAYIYKGKDANLTTGTVVTSSKVTGLSTKSYSIYNTAVDNNLKFGSLALGNYTYALKITFTYSYSADGKALSTGSFSYDGQTQWPVHSCNFSVVPTTPTVTFNGNGGNPSQSSKTVTYDSTYGTLPSATRTGYTFDGWYTSASGGSKVTSSTKVTNPKNHTLYAHWTAYPMTVYFNANASDGYCDTTSKQVTYGGTYGTLPTPTRTGYTFTGWYTSNGLYVDSSTTVSQTGDHYLYAYWAVNSYTVSFNANGGSCDTSSKAVTYGQTYGTLPTPTRAGHTFNGWYTASSGGSYISSSSTMTMAYSHTLYAHWTARSYTVTLNANGGSCSTGSKTVTYGQAYGTMPVPTRKGYTFTGWWTAKDSGGKKVTASTVCYASGNYTLYARWTEGYTMTFNPTGGTVSPTTKVVKYGQQYGTLPTPTRTGYTFVGWWTTKAEGGKQVTSSTVCYASSGYTLFARWTPKKFVITLNPNGGECATATKTVTYGQAYGTMPVPSPRTGYTFSGWWTAKTGGKKVTASTVCYATGNYTLYARWTPKTYTVTFNANGGTCTTGSKTVTYGQEYGTLPVPTRDGYVFAGWYTTQSTGGKQVFSSTICYATGNYTLYARWWKN